MSTPFSGGAFNNRNGPDLRWRDRYGVRHHLWEMTDDYLAGMISYIQETYTGSGATGLEMTPANWLAAARAEQTRRSVARDAQQKTNELGQRVLANVGLPDRLRVEGPNGQTYEMPHDPRALKRGDFLHDVEFLALPLAIRRKLIYALSLRRVVSQSTANAWAAHQVNRHPDPLEVEDDSHVSTR